MRQAKGAVHALLQQAYAASRPGGAARVPWRPRRRAAAALAEPSSWHAARSTRCATGGGTLLAAALLRALDLAQQARGRGIFQTVLVLLTDGRANVGLRAGRDGVEQELQLLGRHRRRRRHPHDRHRYPAQLPGPGGGAAPRWLARRRVYLPAQRNGTQIAGSGAGGERSAGAKKPYPPSGSSENAFMFAFGRAVAFFWPVVFRSTGEKRTTIKLENTLLLLG